MHLPFYAAAEMFAYMAHVIESVWIINNATV